MTLLRRISNGRLTVLLALAVAALVAAGAGIAVAARLGSSAPPPPASLADAVHEALTAPTPDGVSGRLRFSNRLLGGGLLAGAVGSSPLAGGASGRFWITGDGKARLELQGDGGSPDVQVLVDGTSLQVYDVSSHTLYRAQLPARSGTSTPHAPPTVAWIQSALDRLAGAAAIAGPTPTTVAGEGAYEVRLSPKAGGGLLGGAELAWDATHGVPLRLAVYAKGDTTPVLELTATQIAFGPVAASDVRISPAPGTHVVDLGTPGSGRTPGQHPAPVTGVAAVQAQLPFTLVAPDSLAGRQRAEVRLVHAGGDPAALVAYGTGLDSVLVLESQQQPAAAGPAGALALLPAVALGGGVTGHELPTALGTIVRFDRGGVSFTVAASQPAAAVVDAAKTLAG